MDEVSYDGVKAGHGGSRGLAVSQDTDKELLEVNRLHQVAEVVALEELPPAQG
jgi:hypothetical protein